jgi:hydroxypyruvate reductase
MSRLYDDAQKIIAAAIEAAIPDTAVKKALDEIVPVLSDGRLVLVACGKAAWQMASVAAKHLGTRLDSGVAVTKYGHVKGEIPRIACFEAGHPVPDENSFKGTAAALDAVKDLTERDSVLFLVSGGGSALFEKPLVSKEELESITQQLLACGADITEINMVRKRISAVKGGKFAQLCRPAHVYSVILSDIIGDPIDMIASGPAYPDSSTCLQAGEVIEKYGIAVEPETKILLGRETPKELDNVTTMVMGSVKQLCSAAAETAASLGYEPVVLTDRLTCQAREAGSFLGSIAKTHSKDGRPTAFIAGGETVVKLTGSGKGGRNQELALAAAQQIAGLENVAVFSVGSDGTDGPTDAAGGYVDGKTADAILKLDGRTVEEVLAENDAYHALKAAGGLIITGPTGTNVNDVSVVLIVPSGEGEELCTTL